MLDSGVQSYIIAPMEIIPFTLGAQKFRNTTELFQYFRTLPANERYYAEQEAEDYYLRYQSQN